jgi:hypothetical protein
MFNLEFESILPSVTDLPLHGPAFFNTKGHLNDLLLFGVDTII